MLNTGNSIRLFSDMTASIKEDVKKTTRFVSAFYDEPDTDKMYFTRQNFWAARVGKSGEAMPSLACSHLGVYM